jgi:hypothetical protein
MRVIYTSKAAIKVLGYALSIEKYSTLLLFPGLPLNNFAHTCLLMNDWKVSFLYWFRFQLFSLIVFHSLNSWSRALGK